MPIGGRGAKSQPLPFPRSLKSPTQILELRNANASAGFLEMYKMNTEGTQDERLPIRARVKSDGGFVYRLLRAVYYGFRDFEIPVPRLVCLLLWKSTSWLTAAYYLCKSAFLVKPLYKGLCVSVGKRFRAGTFVPYVSGSGRIYFGNDVRAYGKQTFLFAGFAQRMPEIHVGDNSGFGHSVVFDIAGKLTIGRGCLIASGVTFVDCGGHSLQAAQREAGVPPTESDIREISVGNNVWIGTGAYILPGAIIGDNCVVSANTVVSRRIPDNSLVYSPTPKVIEIRDISSIV